MSGAAVRAAVGLERTDVDMGGIVVAVGRTFVGVGGASVDVDATLVAVSAGCVAVGVRVCEGVAEAVGEVPRLISNGRTVDHEPIVPLAVRARTRHQNVRSLVNVWEVWVCVIPVRERSGELNVLASSIWN